MKAFASKEKQSVTAGRKARPYVHYPMGPVQLAQRTEIRHILRSTCTQAKLTVGAPNDKYEQEADRVADQVMRMPDPKLQRQPENEEEEDTLQAKPLADQITPLIQRQAEPEEEEELIQPGYDQEPEESNPIIESVPTKDAGELGGEEELQAKSKAGEITAVTPSLESRINSLKGSGQPLDSSTRAFFEPRFGHDFSQVRMHTDSSAADIAKAINARAFTLGTHVAMGSGEYHPNSRSGQRLLGHELTHVIQQGGCRTSSNAQHLVSIESDPIDDLVPGVQRDAREVRILAASRAYKIPRGTSGCYLHLLLLIDAGRNVRAFTTAGEVERYRKLKRIAKGATVSDLVALLRKKGIARRSRWFHYPKAGRSYRTFKKLSLRGDSEGFVMSRVRTGQPAYFAVSFRNIHSGFILVTSTGKVLWLDQIYLGGKEVTGSLNGFLSRHLDRYVEVNRKKHAWYGSTKITELRF